MKRTTDGHRWTRMGVLAVAVLLAAGCATRRPVPVQPVYVNGIGFAVDFADLVDRGDEVDGGGLWQRYKESWAQAPWLMAGVHVGVLAGGYAVGHEAGWWGGRSGGRSSTTNNTRAQTTDGGGWNVDMSGDGDGDRSFEVHVYSGAPEPVNGNGFQP